MAPRAGQLSPDGRSTWDGGRWVASGGAAAPPGAAGWARPYESSHTRMTLLVIFLVASVVTPIIGILLDLVLIRPTTGTALGLAWLLAFALLPLMFLIAFLATFVPSIALFCLWLHRVVRNLPALGAIDPRWSPAGAVGRCFIPFLNLGHPMAGVLEAWRRSDQSRRWVNLNEGKHLRVPTLMTAWWACWLTGFWLSALFWVVLYLPIDVGNLVAYAVGHPVAYALTGICGNVLTIIAAVLAVLVVREVSARQDFKNMLISTGRLT